MYEQFYGLKNAPFRLSPDPAFFFASQGHNRALAYLRYGLNQKEGFIVITGAPGTGKTMLARSLLQEIVRDKVIIAELNTTHLDADDVLRMVAASFGLEHEGLPKATILKRLESFFISRYRAGYQLLLLVDEAQNLPHSSLEELRMLSNFYLGKDALVQIFLLGQEQFRNSLYTSELEQLRQRVVASSHLDPLNNDETREYIEHRLTLAGWTGSPKISDRAFARLYSFTKGVPRRINTFCERLMLYGSLEELLEFHDDTIKAVAKELMYEVSANGVKLSDINPAVPEVKAAEEIKEVLLPETEKMDSDLLSSFSDEISDSPEEDSVLEDTTVIDESGDKIEPESQVPSISKSKLKNGPKNKQDKKPKNQKVQPLTVVSKGNAAEDSFFSVSEITPEIASSQTDARPDWLDLVALAVAYHNQPSKYKSIASTKTPIPPGISECFKIAIGKMRIPEYLRTGELSELSDQVIRDALRHYIKKVLLSNAADYYRRLGVVSSASFEEVRNNYKYLFRLFQPDKEQNASNWDETFTRRINQAYGTLRSTDKRKEYDEFLAALNLRKAKSKNADDVGSGIEARNTTLTHSQNSAQIEKTNEEVATAAQPDSGESDTANKRVLPGLLIGGVLVAAAAVTYFVLQPDIKSFVVSIEPEASVSAPVVLEGVESDSLIAQSHVAHNESKTSLELSGKPVVKSSVNEFKSADFVNDEIDSATLKLAAVDLGDEPEGIVKATEKNQKVLAIKMSEEHVAGSKEVLTKAAPVVPEPLPVVAVTDVVTDAPGGNTNLVQTKRVQDRRVQSKSLKIAKVTKVTKVTELSVAGVAATQIEAPELTAPKAQSAAKTEKIKPISQKRLDDFVTEFSLAYEEGDLDVFMTFFSEVASTNDARNKLAIRQNYEKFFADTEMRVIDLDNLGWKMKKQEAVGKGAFFVTVLGLGGEEMKKFSGLIKLEIIEVDHQLKLKGMFHVYGASG